MFSFNRFGASLILSIALVGAAGAQDADPPRYPYEAVPGEIVISFIKSAGRQSDATWSPGESVNLLSLLGEGTRIVHTMKGLDGIVVEAPDLRVGEDPEATLRRLEADPAIASAERNFIYYADARPSDPKLGEMWFLPKISAFKAWDRQAKSTGVIVAVIDTGIQLDHEELRGRIWTNPREIPNNRVDDDGNDYIDDVHGWNFYNGTNDPGAKFEPLAKRGCKPHPTKGRFEVHGTHVAGTIGAAANNGRGIIGISHDVKIMAVKALGGPCGSGSIAKLIEAIAYAVRNGAHVINMSLGGSQRSVIMLRELRAAMKANVSIVAAAGNDGRNTDRHPRYPGAFRLRGLVTGAAVGRNDRLAKFSNFSAALVDLAAPGVKILSSIPTGPRGRARSGYYALSGTSMATPIVAGAVALMRARNPKLGGLEIERRLLRAVDRIGVLSGRVRSGGRLNLVKALREAARPVAATGKTVKPSPAAKNRSRRSIGGIVIEGGGTGPDRPRAPTGGLPKGGGEIKGKNLY